jgi:2-polyprenyl-6-methoxyphenol hydroxylase-like FAD-dependent oxidoreductase
VQVFERSTGEFAARGAGIVTHPQLTQALEVSGAKPEGPIGVEIFERVIIDREGAPVRSLRFQQVVTSWAYLYYLLRKTLPDACYRTGHALVEIEQTAGGVEARFANGRSAEGDLLVGADGLSSTTRGLLLPEISPVYVGYVAWRGLLHESELSPATHRMLADRFGFCLPPGEQILGYPVAGEGNSLLAGSRYYNFVWYRPVDATELPALLTDREGLQHSMSLPPDVVRNATLANLRREAEKRLAPSFAEVVRLAPHPFIQVIYEVEATRLVFGRVVLVGDAAFLARPHVGMGVTKAAGDAMALAEALDDADSDRRDDAFARFECRRLEFGKQVVGRSRYLGHLMRAGTSSAPPDPIADQVISLTAAAPDA